MNEVAIFDLDGTLIDLNIDPDDFESCRSYWATYLTSHGVATTLKPLLPELQRVSRTSPGSELRAEILHSFDELEVACRYHSLCSVEAVLAAFKSKFRKLVLVTHNGLALWVRLCAENTWTRLLDRVITRNDTSFFKPDPRVCAAAFKDLTANFGRGELWVIGNSQADRGLGLNLREHYSDRVVRTFMIHPTYAKETRLSDQLDVEAASVDSLLHLLHDMPV